MEDVFSNFEVLLIELMFCVLDIYIKITVIYSLKCLYVFLKGPISRDCRNEFRYWNDQMLSAVTRVWYYIIVMLCHDQKRRNK